MYLQAVKRQQRHLPECHAGTSSLTHAWQLGKALLQQGKRIVAFLPGVGDKGGARPGEGASGGVCCPREAQLAAAPCSLGLGGAQGSGGAASAAWFGAGWMTLGGVTLCLVEKESWHETVKADRRGRDQRTQELGGKGQKDGHWNFRALDCDLSLIFLVKNVDELSK